jgi:hypothetical protein
MEASQHSLLAACFTLHSINATLAIVPQRGAGLWIINDLIDSCVSGSIHSYFVFGRCWALFSVPGESAAIITWHWTQPSSSATPADSLFAIKLPCQTIWMHIVPIHNRKNKRKRFWLHALQKWNHSTYLACIVNQVRAIFSFYRPISKCLPVSSTYSYATLSCKRKNFL